MSPRFLLSFIACLLGTLSLSAQTCTYQLLLEDRVSGDGWNGGQLTVRIAGVTSTYTLGGGSQEIVYLPVSTGDEVELAFLRGAFPEETSFRIFDNDDQLVFEAVSPAETADLGSFTANCVACAPPPRRSIDLFRVRFNSVDIRLLPNPAADTPTYRVEYGLGEDFDPESDEGEVLLTPDSLFRVQGLEANSTYSFFLSTLCATPADTSDRRGPFTIRTQKEVDLGVTLLERPVTGCDASGPIRIGITNYGGAPQQLFDVGFAIDGVEQEVNRPFDGFFTGIVNPDSTEFFTFDSPISLPAPGKYRVSAFTRIGGEEDVSNDQVTLRIVSQPTIVDYPYRENFEENDGFWIVERGNRGATSWAWGQPRGPFLDRAPQGRNAWATNLFGDYFNDEESYLVSPCFDLSGFSEDPYFSASLFVRTAEALDNVRLEMSTDNGESWNTVGISPADVNWYNDRPRQVWHTDGGFGNGPRIVANLLEGAAGETIKLRFAFRSSLDDTDEGILVDAVTIGDRPRRDVSAVTAFGDTQCPGVDIDSLSFTYQNTGTSVVDTVSITYPAAAAVRTVEIIERLAPGNVRTVNLPTETGAGMISPLVITVTTVGDAVAVNDTARVALQEVMEIPFYEDFETGRLPEQWSLRQNAELMTDPATGSLTIIGDLDAATNDTLISFSTGYYRAEEDILDTLFFSINLTGDRATDNFNFTAYTLDCGTRGPSREFTFITTGDYMLPLAELEGDGLIVLELEAIEGSATASFDDVFIRRCPSTLGLDFDVIPVSNAQAGDAVVTVTPRFGTAPYTYDWSFGADTRTVENVRIGRYEVTVSDRFGCRSSEGVSVRNFVSTEDPRGLLTNLSVFPNPTAGALQVDLHLNGPLDILTEVYDATGRRLQRNAFGRLNRLRTSLDLSSYAPGIYLVRVRADGAARTFRVFRQ